MTPLSIAPASLALKGLTTQMQNVLYASGQCLRHTNPKRQRGLLDRIESPTVSTRGA
jgi:hypothetical protein